MYSDTTMDEMVSGTSGLEWVLFLVLLNTCFYLFIFLSESKLDPEGPAYQKMKNSKKFDPKRSSVLMVLNAQVEQGQCQINCLPWTSHRLNRVVKIYISHCDNFISFALYLLPQVCQPDINFQPVKIWFKIFLWKGLFIIFSFKYVFSFWHQISSLVVIRQPISAHIELSDERWLCCGHWRSQGGKVIIFIK